MTDNHKHEKLEATSGESRSELPAKPDVAQARLSLGQTIAKIHEGNLNKHSGSAGSADGSTIEIDLGDGESVSRLNPRRESDLLAARPEGRRSERSESQLKPAAPEGCLIGMNDYFEKYSSPLTDAYNLSKRVPIGAEGKSLTLESVVDRMKSLPWYKDLKVQIDTHGGNSRYDNEHNTLHIRRRSNKSLEVQEAGHESYHASHQLLSKLYDHGKITQADFVSSFMKDEAQSFVIEIKIRHELTGKYTEPVEFVARGAKNERLPINMEHVYASGNLAGLIDVLAAKQPFEQGQKNYREHYSECYPAYLNRFDRNLPYVKKYLDLWVAAGYKREQL